MKIIPAAEIDIPDQIRDKKDSKGRRIGKRNRIFKHLLKGDGGFREFSKTINEAFWRNNI